MCGIAGAVGPRPVDRAIVEAQLRQLEHRGPDSWGVHAAGNAVIGQTRLAVIDLVTGDPPITDEDGAIGVAMNGEIYNYAALRDRLRAAGHRFSTAGDTEVIAHLAETNAPADLASTLVGMFAFAVWDDRRQQLILGRDRLGKKPLYYWHGQGGLVFGSEIKALLVHPDVPRRVDQDAVPAYLQFGYVPSPRTMYEGIRSLPPGHVLTFSPGGVPTESMYWDPRLPEAGGSPRIDVDLEDAAVEVRRRLTAAVERRLVADVPLGAFLSGGIDSSAVVGIMAGLTSRPVRTFTIGFDDTDGYDEREHAREVARRFATDHVEFVVKPSALDLLEELVWHHDQPFGDASAIPTYLLSRLTREHVTVALCGDGADELFAGYERFSAALVLDRVRRAAAPLGPRVRKALTSAVLRLPPTMAGGRMGSLQRFARSAELDPAEAYISWVSVLAPEQRQLELVRPTEWHRAHYREVLAATAGAPLLDRLLDLNLRTYLLDDLLPKVDRMAMAHGLEVRAPFLDHDLVEYAIRLPASLKARGWTRKRVLKAAVSDLLPPSILNRRKRGFGVPLDRWFRTDLRSLLHTRLGSSDARVLDHVRPDSVRLLLAEHEAGHRDHGLALWTLLTLEAFLRREEGLD